METNRITASSLTRILFFPLYYCAVVVTQEKCPEYMSKVGKISVWGHSLGAVVMMGLLSRWSEDFQKHYDRLEFDV